MYDAIKTEIIEIHEFFQQWFRGEIAATPETFARLTDVLHPDFIHISDDGHLMERVPLVEAMHKGHGQLPGISLWVEKLRLCYELGDSVVVAYEEWKQNGEDKVGMMSTAILRRQANRPHGIEWLYLHDTSIAA